MNYYFAPLEGITGYVYRNAYHTQFHHMDKYFTPFLSPTHEQTLSSRAKNDLAPLHNQGLRIVPQILTNDAGDFIRTVNALQDFGYHEVNLNLGCPSGTVVSKYKGAGLLSDPERLSKFLDQIFTELSANISIKTRLGMNDSAEFPALLDIFNRYPLKELILHPRVRSDFYKNKPHLASFADALTRSKAPICYNGDLFTVQDYHTFVTAFPTVQTVMFGRGSICNPGLIRRIVHGTVLTLSELRVFHDSIYEGYHTTLPGTRPVLCKMKELWLYMLCLFPASERYGKRIKKSQTFLEYDRAVSALFRDMPLDVNAGYCP